MNESRRARQASDVGDRSAASGDGIVEADRGDGGDRDDRDDRDDRTGPTQLQVTAPLRVRTRDGRDEIGADQAIRDHALGAVRGFVRLVIVLVLAVAVAAPLLAIDRAARVVLSLGLAVALIGSWRTVRILRRGHLHSNDGAWFGMSCVLGASAGTYAFGFFSPAPLAIIMVIFFFGMQPSLRVAFTVYLTASLFIGAGEVVTSVGWIVDRGLVRADGLQQLDRLVMAALTQVLFGLVFLLARAVHRAVVDAVQRLEASTRAVAHREALLEEARRELERALEIGGPGRFTEQQLGPWQLGVLCGRGAMGDVYHATHVGTGDRAAVKLLHREAVQQPGHLRRFLREARIATSIDVPNVVRVIEVGADDAPVPYLAMELLSGTDLASLLRRRRRLTGDEVVDLLHQIGRGLDAAHRLGVVHRDLKPQNLFLADSAGPDAPVWKLLDFGVSRLIGADSSLTRGQAVGTPSYMSPEQARGRDVDHRADLFALGVVAYRALTGRPPFTGREVPQILYHVVHAMPPRPSEVADLSPAVDDVLAVALAKRPADRFESAGELAAALEAALAGRVALALQVRAERLATRWPWGYVDSPQGAPRSSLDTRSVGLAGQNPGPEPRGRPESERADP